MRLWSFHPRYLDRRGLVALWRESLLAQAVLHGRTRGYRNHPQLERFSACARPLDGIALYLRHVHLEATGRGYSFDGSKYPPVRRPIRLAVTTGQLDYEWRHLQAKLQVRDPMHHEMWKEVSRPEPHPLFATRPGDVEPWERQAP